MLKELQETLASQGQVRVTFRMQQSTRWEEKTVTAADEIGIVLAGDDANQFSCVPWAALAALHVKRKTAE